MKAQWIGRSLAVAACLGMSASPALADGWRGHRGGWGHHRHDRSIDAGDVFAGLLILGGIAAVASAISKKNPNRTRGEQAPPPPPPADASRNAPDGWYEVPGAQGGDDYGAGQGDGMDDRQDAPPTGPDAAGPNGGSDWGAGRHSPQLDNAVEACAAEVGKRGPVDQIWSAGPVAGGFEVRGGLTSGAQFTCTVDSQGRVSNLSTSGDARTSF
ncbi:hypothetical protein [Novosphingobium cyanobacteriorum]|uniref:Uncharacterized protein n=1 Tax=Novosphingobium cyanobacteriorum TaxID=3024215 RepID=A0ABT6CN68_9SPHN|nr:hypothetical protein [Novosphingobium cyanobacteriorum]MDF8335251.1 hypothetical protein [Novosphingobium cyanobacteriorum]